MWIKREIQEILSRNNAPVQVLIGPRQCGKTSLLKHISPNFQSVTLDDLKERELAQKDPAFFLDRFSGPIIIDEIQYAPNLMSEIKKRIDMLRSQKPLREVRYRLTGSNQILLDQQVKESLAGRASYFNLNTLSVSEIIGHNPKSNLLDILFNGGWPELYIGEKIDNIRFLNDYLRSYVEKDVILTAGIQKTHEFTTFLGLIAARVGQIINYADLSRDAGVNAQTIKEWIGVLERMKVISLVQPFHSNISKRLIKSPKLYFWDTGLAVRLQSWSEPQAMIKSPQAGALFENLVFAEIAKHIQNYDRDWKIFFWRTKDGEELDFVVQKSPSDFQFIEVKLTNPPLTGPILDTRDFSKEFGSYSPHIHYVHFSGSSIMKTNSHVTHVPLSQLTSALQQ